VKQTASTDDFLTALRSLDGRGYRQYKTLEGPYGDGRLVLTLEHAQGDPFAQSSRVRLDLSPDHAAIPAWALATPDRRRATADFLNRRMCAETPQDRPPDGSGRSGEIAVLRPGQQVLARASVEVTATGSVTARVRLGLPARGRRIQGAAAAHLVRQALDLAGRALRYPSLDAEALRRHVETVEDAVALRAQLPDLGLVAFVSDGALLPRRSGVDDRPMDANRAVPFESPATLRRTLVTPNAGPVSGMGIPEGVTLIVGGGYHGKSTLLRALERGVYDHIPGDGREQVVTLSTAVKIRAEDGRRIAGTDISNFITDLPDGSDTTRFETDNASGSTSQAAAIVEALEAGAGLLLLDEDTSATNFMIRDARMQRLIASRDEPITPFLDRARDLLQYQGVSTILVIGGSGDYFDVADQTIAMRRYHPEDVSRETARIAAQLPLSRVADTAGWTPVRPRRPDPASLDPTWRHRSPAIRVLARDRVEYAGQRVDLGSVDQLMEEAQTRAMAFAVAGARDRALDGSLDLGEAVARMVEALEAGGVVSAHPHRVPELASFRPLELAAFLNRLRSFRTIPGPEIGAGGSDAGAKP
jgi:predicted ABC-class ATPase